MAFRTHARHAELARRRRAVGTAKPNGLGWGTGGWAKPFPRKLPPRKLPPPGNFRPERGWVGDRRMGQVGQRDARRAASVSQSAHLCGARHRVLRVDEADAVILVACDERVRRRSLGEARRDGTWSCARRFRSANGTRPSAAGLIGARCGSGGRRPLERCTRPHAGTMRHAPQAR